MKYTFSNLSEQFAVVLDTEYDVFQPFTGNGGTLVVAPAKGTTPVTYINLASGVYHPILITKVYTSGTTCNNIIGGR